MSTPLRSVTVSDRFQWPLWLPGVQLCSAAPCLALQNEREAMTNGFNDIGFLGDDLDSWRDNVRAEFPESFAIADRMNRMGMRMIRDIPEGERPLSQGLALAGFYRALQSFQSAILLAERGALAEARALVRLCCEAVILVGGLLKVEGTVEKLNEDHEKHVLSMANSMIELNRQAKTGADLTPFESEVARVKAEYPEEQKPASLKWASMAAQAGLGRLFELSYRLPSGDGAHVTLSALHRHFDKDKEGEIVGMIFHPDKSDLQSTMLAANASLIHALGLVQEFMDLGQYEAEIRDLLLQWSVTRKELEHE
ncbi:hypothetical protein BM43_5437 [Burkholderia gladioli]|uniref:Uncharacterized protein n=3 Tax=Burkholderia gladioli TaxID=28095 RepID=A0AAW3EW09_BURGA|nr:hypothetical protein BM43_5437 [Burkholderia gladioli]KGC12862.1 hypothetical protein DM48_2329 [Burkholderia gladioli]SPV14710.1 Uncharacterised protein [Burkholderia gladioli]